MSDLTDDDKAILAKLLREMMAAGSETTNPLPDLPPRTLLRALR
jgi:hypothetical protein